MDSNEFKKLIIFVKNDILNTQCRVTQNANYELLNLYYRLGKILSDNVKYGNKFIENISISLRLEFPRMVGFSKRNLSRMKLFYEEYKDFDILPPAVAKLSWTNNCLLIEKIKDLDIRLWYAEKCTLNGWSKVVLMHQIELNLYERQFLPEKLTNFDDKLSLNQSSFAKELIKDPYIFELENIKEMILEKDLEEAMLVKIKNVLLELGKGFSFVGNQYRISTEKYDYYIDMLFYNLDLRCYVVVELKTTQFKPEYVGQLGFYVTAVDEVLKKDCDSPTIGLLLCKNKDKLSVKWSLQSINSPIGVSSYKVCSSLLNKLPTEQEINSFIVNYED